VLSGALLKWYTVYLVWSVLIEALDSFLTRLHASQHPPPLPTPSGEDVGGVLWWVIQQQFVWNRHRGWGRGAIGNTMSPTSLVFQHRLLDACMYCTLYLLLACVCIELCACLHVRCSVADLAPVLFWPLNPESGAFLTPGSGIRIRYEHPTSYVRELKNNFLG
jgi:hypothetical protein